MKNIGYTPWFRIGLKATPHSTEEMIGALESDMDESLEDFREEED